MLFDYWGAGRPVLVLSVKLLREEEEQAFQNNEASLAADKITAAL